ncbi:MAG: restriction endonuclease subunit S [Candidatus Eremiobacteraeota bacterium]|nr:restriction endonuclease subunit S [Candidatus Eremiobacteraeota bacterium]
MEDGYKVYEQRHAIYKNFKQGEYYISKEMFEKLRRFSLEPDDIIMSCSGTAGKFAIVPKSAKPGVINQALLKITPNTHIVNISFIFYFFHSLFFRKHLFLDFSGGAIKNIASMNILRRIPIKIPPFPEQKKIAEILSAWDRPIEQVRKLIDAKQRLKKGLMQKLLTGRIRFREFGKPAKNKGELPEGWKSVKAKRLFQRRSKKNCGDEIVLSVTQDQGVIPRDSLDKKINMSVTNTDSYKLVEPGDYVISLRSFQGGLEYSRIRGIVSPAYQIIHPELEIDDHFYRYYFKSYRFIGHLAVAVIGIRDGKQINYDDFAYMRIPYPAVEEQRHIAKVLDACDRKIKFLQKKESALKRQKKGLMQKLLTGEIRVKSELMTE